MRVIVDYADETEGTFAKEYFEEVATKTIAECGFDFLQGKTITVHVIALSESAIRALNREYRGLDAATDVLSFGEYPDREMLEAETKGEMFLGEVFLAPAFIERAAREDEVTIEREMTYIFSHGILHLAGFDHEEEMFEIQERVTDFFSN